MADNKNAPSFIGSQGNQDPLAGGKTKEELAREQSKDGDPIDLRAKQTVYSTDKDINHVTGEAFHVHPKVAQDLIKNGFASETEAEANSTKKEEKK